MIKHLKRSEKVLLGFIAASALGVALTGILFYRTQAEATMRGATQSLVAVTDLKVSQLVAWREERINDARFLMTAPAVARDVELFMAAPEDAVSKRVVQQWLTVMKGGTRYTRMVLFDVEGRARMSIPENTKDEGVLPRRALREVMEQRQVKIVDLHRNELGHVVMDVIAPIFLPPAPESELKVEEGRTTTLSGLVLMEIDPDEFLYPLIDSWPVASESAESLLCRKEGNQILFLNEPRYPRGEKGLAGGAAGSVKPLTELAPMPRGMAGLDEAQHSVVQEEVDYRGNAVVMAMRGIPGSAWYLLSKVDRNEVKVPIRRLAYGVMSVVGVLISVGGALWILVLGRARTGSLMQELEAERRLKALAQRLALVTQHANEIILITDLGGVIFDANEMAVTSYGYSIDELRHMSLSELRTPMERMQIEVHLQQVATQRSALYETVHVTREGHEFPVEVSSRIVELDGKPAMMAIVRDISQRRQHELEIQRLNHLYEALTQINQMLIRANDLDTLLKESCRIMVQYGRFWMVWIGRYDVVEQRIFPVASEGEELSFLQGFSMSTKSEDPNLPPTLMAVMKGHSEVCRDFNSIALGPWKERLANYRFKASAAFPIRHRHRIWGNLTVYSVDPNSFGRRECELIEETAADISYAMDVMADRVEHRRMEHQLRENELRFRTLFETMSEIVVLHELVNDALGNPIDYRVIDCNSSFCAVLGIPRERAVGTLGSKLYGTGQAPYLVEYSRVAISGQPCSFESYFEPLKRHFSISVASPGPGRFATVSTDITVRKQTESELKESEQRFRATFEHAAAGIAHVDINGHFLRVNQRLCELLGRTRDELLRSSIHDVTHPEDLSADLSQIRRLLSGEVETYSMEKRYIAHNGGVVWAQLTVSLVQHPEGVPHYLIAVIQDIGLRKQAEAALRGSEERYRRLTRAVTDYVYTVRIEEGRPVETIHGEGCIAVTGYAPREFFQNQHLWIDMVVQEDRPLVLALGNQILKNHGAGAVEHRIRRKDGRIRWVRNTTSPHLDSKGVFLSYDGLVQDITERKQAEVQLRETNEELHATNRIIAVCGSSIDLDSVVHSIIDQAILVTGLEGATLCLLGENNTLQLVAERNASAEVVQALSHQAVRVGSCLCGNCAADCRPLVLNSPEQISVYATQQYHHNDRLHFHAAYPLLAQKTCLGVLCLFTRKDGKPMPASLRIIEALCPSFALAVQNALLHRETVRYGTQMETLVKGRTAELQVANQELESFSYSVSHDLRAPLRAIHGVMQILLEDHGAELNAEVRQNIDIVCSESQRMGRLIDDLLAFSRLGRQALHPLGMDLSVLLAEVKDELLGREQGRRIEWVLEPLPTVEADPVFIRQVFINILGNALKYTRKCEVTRIEVTGRVEGEEAIVSIRDNGAGFDMKYVDRLFGVFQRLHTDKEFEGTGVGLALVQRIIQRHGGRVWAESELGKGATFHFALPVQKRDAAYQAAQ